MFAFLFYFVLFLFYAFEISKSIIYNNDENIKRKGISTTARTTTYSTEATTIVVHFSKYSQQEIFPGKVLSAHSISILELHEVLVMYS